MSDQENRSELLELASEIIAAHVSNNTLAVNDLPPAHPRCLYHLGDGGKGANLTRAASASGIDKKIRDP